MTAAIPAVSAGRPRSNSCLVKQGQAGLIYETLTAAALFVFVPCLPTASGGQHGRNISETPNIVVRWNSAVLQGVRDSKLGPPMVARALAIVHTCMYDAWALYS